MTVAYCGQADNIVVDGKNIGIIADFHVHVRNRYDMITSVWWYRGTWLVYY